MDRPSVAQDAGAGPTPSAPASRATDRRDTASATPAPSDAARQRIALPGQITLSDLVELVSKRLGLTVQFQREALSKSVSLRMPEPLSDDELWRVLTAVLEGNGLVVVRSDRPALYRIVQLQSAAAENQHVALPTAEAAAEGGASAPERASYVAVIVRLKSMTTDDATRAVQPLLTPASGLVKPIGDGGLILLSDVKRRVEQAQAVLAMLDGPPDPVTSFVIEFRALVASEAGKLLESVSAAQLAADPRRGRSAGPLSSGLGSAPTPGPSGSVAVAARLIPLAGDRRAMVICAASAESSVRRLLQELDQREPRETRSYSAAGIGVDELATSIRQLLEPDRPAAILNGAPLADAPRVTSDKLTGSVMVSATPGEHGRVAALIDRLNALPPSARQSLRSFPIKNRDASELSQTLRELLGTGGIAVAASNGTAGPVPAPAVASGLNVMGLTAGSPPPVAFGVPIASSGVTAPVPTSASTAGNAATTPAPTPAPAPIPSGGGSTFGLQITIDKPTNTIIAVGEPAVLTQLESLVSALDKRQPQVLLDVSLVTLTESEALSFGVELQRQFNEGKTAINLASLFGLATGGALQAGTGFTGTVVRMGDYQAVVRALETLNFGRTLSMPKVLVNNNTKSTLKSVQRQPFTSINASNTVATTSFGGTQDAGTTVTVKPQITEGDHLVLDYAVELSAFTGAPTTLQGGGIIPPPSQQNTVEGNVTLPDGSTVIVGGLSNSTTGKSTARVPLLGAIPVLGALFGTTSDNESSGRFFVFIRATIMRDPAFEDLKGIQAKDLAQNGIHSGVPNLDPLWVE